MTPCSIEIAGAICARIDEHVHCASCGLSYIGDVALCNHHVYGAETWAAENKMMCDFFHRRIEPRRLRLPTDQRDEPEPPVTWSDAA